MLKSIFDNNRRLFVLRQFKDHGMISKNERKTFSLSAVTQVLYCSVYVFRSVSFIFSALSKMDVSLDLTVRLSLVLSAARY